MTSSMSPGGDSSAMKILDTKYEDGSNVITKFNWIIACVDCKRKGISEKCSHVTRYIQNIYQE